MSLKANPIATELIPNPPITAARLTLGTAMIDAIRIPTATVAARARRDITLTKLSERSGSGLIAGDQPRGVTGYVLSACSISRRTSSPITAVPPKMTTCRIDDTLSLR